MPAILLALLVIVLVRLMVKAYILYARFWLLCAKALFCTFPHAVQRMVDRMRARQISQGRGGFDVWRDPIDPVALAKRAWRNCQRRRGTASGATMP